MTAVTKRAKNTNDIKKLAVICVCAAAAAAFIGVYARYGQELLSFVRDETAFKSWLEGFKGGGAVLFVIIRAVQTVIKIIPAEPLEIGAGYVYGTWYGLLLCMLGTEIGSLIIIGFTKLFGMKMLNLFVPKNKLESLSYLRDSKKAGPLLFLIYLIPSTPKDLITYLAGFINMKTVTFMLITGIARIPSIITST
ncbi:MAG: VTT domain-containing protein [Clostridiales bacterium]|nr:VTT domain-containing protein [Clostridiales bacterium]